MMVNYEKHFVQMRRESMEMKKIQLLKDNGYGGLVMDGEIFETLVLHESEFLEFVLEELAAGYEVESSFLSLATRVSPEVFDTLKKVEDYAGITSIVNATVGLLNLAKMAQEFYGIAYFATISCDPDEMKHLGKGFYKFCIC
jgi:hypothetical protein